MSIVWGYGYGLKYKAFLAHEIYRNTVGSTMRSGHGSWWDMGHDYDLIALPHVLPHVQVSTGLVPRLLTLLPQMERLAKGASCNPYPPSHPLAPQCQHSDYYAPAFWPERLTRRGYGEGEGPPFESSPLYSAFASMTMTAMRNKTMRLRGGAGDGKGNWSNFRVVVSSDDSRVEAMLSDYDVRQIIAVRL